MRGVAGWTLPAGSYSEDRVAERDMTVEILRQIRDEIRATRTDLSGRLDQTNERLDVVTARLGTMEGALLDVAEQQRFVVRWLRAGTRRDKQLEKRVDQVEARVDALETRTGSREP